MDGPKNSKAYVSGKYDTHPYVKPHRGCAVVIDNVDIDPKYGNCCSNDAKDMEKLFKFLGYDVKVHTKLEKQRFLHVFDKIGETDHSKYDSFVCCILSFGGKE